MDPMQARSILESAGHDLDEVGRAAFLFLWAVEAAGTGRGKLIAEDAARHARRMPQEVKNKIHESLRSLA